MDLSGSTTVDSPRRTAASSSGSGTGTPSKSTRPAMSNQSISGVTSTAVSPDTRNGFPSTSMRHPCGRRSRTMAGTALKGRERCVRPSPMSMNRTRCALSDSSAAVSASRLRRMSDLGKGR